MSGLSNIQLPPDGAGKRVGTHHTHEIEYSGSSAPNQALMVLGAEIQGDTSGYIGKILRHDDHSTTSGALSLEKDHLTPEGVNGFTPGENLSIEGTVVGTADDAGYHRHYNMGMVVSQNNPHYGQDVDVRGQAYVRFYEGSPQFDAFGKLRVSQPRVLAEYTSVHYPQSDDFAEVLMMGGTGTWLPDEAGYLQSIGTADTAMSMRTTHKYHRYAIGNSQFIEMTCRCGDAGKANVQRQWGYLDTEDGIAFQLMGTTLQVLLRSSVTGSVVNTTVNQADWNGDRLDGSGLSGMVIDVTKVNIYWMDFQWLGAGAIRFGVFAPDGSRVVCHTMRNANQNDRTYMRTGSLPLRTHVMNMGVSGSTSEMTVYSAAVKTEGEYMPHHHDFSFEISPVAFTTTPKPLMSMRMKQLFNGKDNRTYAIPQEVSLFSDAAFAIEFRLHPTLTGATWAVDPDEESGCEFDLAASASTGGHLIGAHYFDAGAHTYEMHDHFDYIVSHFLRREFDIAQPGVWLSVVVRSLTGTANVQCYLTWEETR